MQRVRISRATDSEFAPPCRTVANGETQCESRWWSLQPLPLLLGVTLSIALIAAGLSNLCPW